MYDILTDDKKHLEKFSERFDEVKACNDKKIKEYRLGALMTDMESVFDIPKQGHLRIEAFKVAFPDVWSLYKTITNERWA
ncbi:hypothetical protein [Halolactibacillus sp. JCM 19043]|uniref:hypothetical protein n=1 Tax=Halolactibacillus sp. JCM 19043 TaxID=1460638 RepID=UPI000782DA55|nr:hypothetical protein [Halolactibacillus sp. JCM 19043]